jgi:hypothetical protein
MSPITVKFPFFICNILYVVKKSYWLFASNVQFGKNEILNPLLTFIEPIFNCSQTRSPLQIITSLLGVINPFKDL